MSHVLLIEDDPWFGELLQTVLCKADHSVDWQRDGYDAFESIDARRPAVIVLDLMLPWANGLQLLHELASHADINDIPVVLCSAALPASAGASNLAAYGVAATIDKADANPRYFIQVITEVIHRHANRL